MSDYNDHDFDIREDNVNPYTGDLPITVEAIGNAEFYRWYLVQGDRTICGPFDSKQDAWYSMAPIIDASDLQSPCN